ncbi:HNH endonuclease [Kitasatospora sp. NPDC092286]|uniref:HNH endonuclease n=1 Tax=Kitasatospora sp. NPDC092286 TaxID=3364087 RepID=UPI0037FA2E4F
MVGMPDDRPAIPRELDRRVRVEAGHRCAIPHCRMPVLDIAHIRPWAKVQRHEFENLIALCPTCHRLFHRGDIDRKSMLHYKARLSPFSPYALAAHPDHIDLLAAYQKFRAFIDMWVDAAHAFSTAKQQRVGVDEGKRAFQAVGDAAMEASYARLCFAAESPTRVTRMADQIMNAAVWSASTTMGMPVPAAFTDLKPASDDLAAMWADLDQEIHEVLNSHARKKVKLMPQRPHYVDELDEAEQQRSG